nr:MAG TPA: inhibitor [Caudoviricetes sp.]
MSDSSSRSLVRAAVNVRNPVDMSVFVSCSTSLKF